jgi:hypothetical protein
MPAVYDRIPEVKKSYVDVLIHHIPYNNTQISVAIQYEEKLISNGIVFEPTLHSKGDLAMLNAHKIIDLNTFKAVSFDDLDDSAIIKKLSEMLDLTYYSH